MPIITHPRPTHRSCSWCATEFAVCMRPGRPRLYCGHACRQRAYEHRHGFTHARPPVALPGQHRGQTWTGSGYERGGMGILRRKVHALRTSVRPEGPRRQTLCGVLAVPIAGQHYSPYHPKACRTCQRLVERTPLRYGISASNELAQLRALIEEAAEARLPPERLIDWIVSNTPVIPRRRAG